MRTLTGGVWSTGHRVLDLIGRSAASWLPTKTCSRDDEACCILGGAIIGGPAGAILGFAWLAQPNDLSPAGGAIIGCLLGICMGICCGGIVQSVDVFITDVLRSLDRK